MASILTIIPYTFFPPIGGGALRCFHLLQQLAQCHDVYVLTSQPAAEFKNIGPPEFPKSVSVISYAQGRKYRSLFNILPNRVADAINFRFLTRSLKGPTNTAIFDVLPTLSELIENVKFDLILYESLEALDVASNTIKAKNKQALHLYDAHNCDSELWAQLADANKNELKYKAYAAKAMALERALYKHIDGIMCCSLVDYNKLISLNQHQLNGIVIPNGVDTKTRPYDGNENKPRLQNILFCGSLDYFPNKQGLLWFYKNVFPLVKRQMPLITLTVIGSLTSTEDYKELIADSAVNFVGKVDSVVPFYGEASVAVVPLLSGSGTRLKILEAMSTGNPVVSTTIGAEGIEYKAGHHLLIADTSNEFAQQVIALLKDESLFNLLRENSLKLVEDKYTWDKIGKDLNAYFDGLLTHNSTH